MHHNLEWIKQLNIEYDLSTFDTDPFEPQSDGVGTIFPFIVKRNNDDNNSYVELPYTLVQDFTVFVLMNENNPNIWKEKTDWIANHGGMVLVNVHPDYISIENSASREEEFSVSIYIEFLEHIKKKFYNYFCHPKPAALFYASYVPIIFY